MSANDKAAATYGPGRTAPPLEARIAVVADGVIGYECKHQDFDNSLHEDAPGKCHHCYQLALKIAAELAPVLEQVRADAKREALTEAADKFQVGDWHGVIEGPALSRISNGQRVTDWLRARAAGL